MWEEITIGQIHEAIEAGEITCVELVEYYLERIEVYDQPTRLNAMVVLNGRARERAAEPDAEYARTGQLRALHGIPVIVKDNYDTHDLQTAAGSLSMRGSSPYGNNSPQIPPHTGQPAMTVPMGFTKAGLPTGMQILGRPFGEPAMIRCAYGYEQATRHRRPPKLYGKLIR